MCKELTLTKKEHNTVLLAAAKQLLVFVPIIIIIYFTGIDSKVIYVAIAIAALAIFSLEYYLIMDYYQHSKGLSVCIDKWQECISYTYNNKKVEMRFADVKRIVLYKTFTRKFGVHRRLPYDDYYYCNIMFADDSNLIVTSLMSKNLDNELSKITNITVEVQTVLYPNIV